MLWNTYDTDDSGIMEEPELRKFFDMIAKRWKMLELDSTEQGFGEMMNEITYVKNSKLNYINQHELTKWILEKAKEEWMTDEQKKLEDIKTGGQVKADWRTKMLETWREANVNNDEYLELDEAKDFFARVNQWCTSLAEHSIELPDTEEGF